MLLGEVGHDAIEIGKRGTTRASVERNVTEIVDISSPGWKGCVDMLLTTEDR